METLPENFENLFNKTLFLIIFDIVSNSQGITVDEIKTEALKRERIQETDLRKHQIEALKTRIRKNVKQLQTKGFIKVRKELSRAKVEYNICEPI